MKYIKAQAHIQGDTPVTHLEGGDVLRVGTALHGFDLFLPPDASERARFIVTMRAALAAAESAEPELP